MEAERVNAIAQHSKISAAAPPSCGGIFDFDAKKARLVEVDRADRRSDDLERPASARRTSARERKTLEVRGRRWSSVDQGLRDNRGAVRTGRGRETTTACSSRRQPTSNGVEKVVADLEFRRMFSNPMDPNNCFLDIQAGSGGTEAQDWARCSSACICASASARASRSKCWKNPPAKSPASRARRSRSAATMPSARCAPRPASIGWCASRRSIPTPAATPPSRACSSIPRWTTRSRSRSIRPTCASTPSARAAPAASTSTRPTPRSASRTSRPASSCSARTTARSTATGPRRWRC